MLKSQIDAAALFAAAVAGALALLLLPGAFMWFASIGGLCLFLVIFSFDREGYRSVFQSLAFAAVAGLCLTIAGSVVVAFLASEGTVHASDPRIAGEWLPLTWVGVTLAIWAIDRARMGSREAVEESLRPALTSARGFIPAPVLSPAPVQQTVQPAPPTPMQPAFQPAAAAPRPAPPSTATSWTTATSAPVSSDTAVWAAPQAVRQEPVYTPATTVVPSPAAVESPLWPAAPQTVAASAPASSSVQTPPTAPVAAPVAPPRTGKETMIYVTLVGEGMNVLRSVRAEHVGRDYYRIIDEMPAGETWQFQPGQIVLCKKKNLSSGKALVAIEEAPRAK